jgi:tetratricopeptide (TPR) repeat protein
MRTRLALASVIASAAMLSASAAFIALFVLCLFSYGAESGFAQSTQIDDLTICAQFRANADKSIESCTNILNNSSTSPQIRATALTFRALAWHSKNDLERATTDLIQAIDTDATFALAYKSRGDLLREIGECDLAISDYSRVLQLIPESGPTFLGRGLCFMQLKDFEGALSDFDQVIKLDNAGSKGGAATAWSAKGQIHATETKFDQSISDYDAAIQLDPRRAEFFIYRGDLNARKGDNDKALADYDDAIGLDTKNQSGVALIAWLAKGRLHAQKDDTQAALFDYERAIDLNPMDASLYLQRAIILSHSKDYLHAIADYDLAIKFDPNNAFAYTARGDLYRMRGEYDKAISDYDQAIQVQPDNSTAYVNRALARFYRGDYASAADDFRNVLGGAPNTNSLLWLYVSRVHADPDHILDARDELKKASRQLKADDWPAPLIQLFLGKLSLESALTAAKTPNQKCEVQFYTGEWQLLQKDRTAAVKFLKDAIEICGKESAEYEGAIEEMKRLN